MNGFESFDEPHNAYLKNAFEDYVEKNKTEASNCFGAHKATPHFEGELQTIEEVHVPVLPCPVDTLPSTVRLWISTHAEQMQIPPDFLLAPFLVYVGSLLGRKRALKLRQGTDWYKHANLWGMVIGCPSVMKTPAMKVVRSPLNNLAVRAKENYDQALKQYSLDSEAWKIRQKAHDERYKTQIKKRGKDVGNIELIREEEPQLPVYRRYKTDDSTIEKLGELLIENPQGLLLFRDEISGWLLSFEKQVGRAIVPFSSRVGAVKRTLTSIALAEVICMCLHCVYQSLVAFSQGLLHSTSKLR